MNLLLNPETLSSLKSGKDVTTVIWNYEERIPKFHFP